MKRSNYVFASFTWQPFDALCEFLSLYPHRSTPATLFTLIWKFHVPLGRLSLKHPLERIAFLYHREQWLVNKLWVVLNKGSQRNTKAFVLATSRRLRKGYYRKQKGKNISCVSEKNSKTSPCCELDKPTFNWAKESPLKRSSTASLEGFRTKVN